jgi:tRNA(fMet)-specific endonuclease VapC
MRNHPQVTEAIGQASAVFISVISIGELRAGFLKGTRRRRNEELLRRFITAARTRVLNVDEETTERYAVIHDHLRREGTPIPLNDLWIAATAWQHGLRLQTFDEHFLRVPQILVDFYEPIAPSK